MNFSDPELYPLSSPGLFKSHYVCKKIGKGWAFSSRNISKVKSPFLVKIGHFPGIQLGTHKKVRSRNHFEVIAEVWFRSRDFDHVKMHTQSGLPHWRNNYLFILRRPIQTHVYCWYYRARNVLYSWWSGQDHVISKLIEKRWYCNFRKFFECGIF